jgi:glycosyltransferase involved in cell wall biosynthesis
LKKICFILTAEFAVRAFLLNHLRALSQLYEVTVIVNTDNQQFLSELGLNVRVTPLQIARKISIVSDIRSLIKLIQIFNREKFSAIHSITPKAGLLAMLAGLIVGVPLRIHTFTGQVWANKSGIKRFLLKKIDWFIGLITTDNIVDGRSQLEFLIDQHVLDKKKSIVFLNGSIAGVDIVKFSPNPVARIKIRDQLGIHQNDVLLVYVGRLNRDKGVIDLVHSFNRLRHSNAHIIFVGPDEENMRAKIEEEHTNRKKNIHFVEYTNQPQDYMAAADVLCLPSYR